MISAVTQFKSLIYPWLDAYDRIIVSAIGINEASKKRLLSANILLAPGISKEQVDVLPLNEKILWGQIEIRQWDPGEFEELLNDAIKGIVNIGGVKASLPENQNQPFHSNFYAGHHPAFGGNQSAQRFPALIVNGGSRRALLESGLNGVEIDWHLRALSPPFFDLADLHTHFRLTHPSRIGDQSLIELMIRPPIGIDGKSTISDKFARINLVASKRINRAYVAVGYRSIEGPQGVKRAQIPNDLISWKVVGDLLEGEINFEVNDIPAIQCFLSYAGSAVQQWWIVDPTRHLNMRHAIHSAFDRNQAVLKRLLLDPKRSDSREFEDGVAMLLGMQGFSVTQHGRTQKLSDAPDIVAIAPSRGVAVVECTVGLPDQDDQVAKVLQRTEAIRKALTQSGWPNVELLPIVVTALPEVEVKLHKTYAESQGVLVISKETIELALDQVRLPGDADQIFANAVARLKRPQF